MQTPKPIPTESANADLAYQKAILGSVSRTFALTIPLLPPSIEKVVGNTYLLCRIVDTIEDAAHLSPDTKQSLSRLFLDAVLEKAPVQSFVAPCLEALQVDGNPDELDLIANTPTVLEYCIPAQVQTKQPLVDAFRSCQKGCPTFITSKLPQDFGI